MPRLEAAADAVYNPSHMKSVLTIAGFDPTGGAGLQADLAVFRALGVRGLSAVAALTAQNSNGVAAVSEVGSRFLRRQLDVLFQGLLPDAVKIGMLLTGENVRAVGSAIRRYDLRNVVLDPVFLSSTGKRLAEKDVPALLREKIIPRCSVVTPNLHEASVLAGMKIRSSRDREKAAAVLHSMGAQAVIITGGHSEGSADDLFCDGTFHLLKGKRVQGEFHGTGCTFSAAVAGFLAQGKSPLQAAKSAKAFMRNAFGRSISTGGRLRLFDIR